MLNRLCVMEMEPAFYESGQTVFVFDRRRVHFLRCKRLSFVSRRRSQLFVTELKPTRCDIGKDRFCANGRPDPVGWRQTDFVETETDFVTEV